MAHRYSLRNTESTDAITCCNYNDRCHQLRVLIVKCLISRKCYIDVSCLSRLQSKKFEFCLTKSYSGHLAIGLHRRVKTIYKRLRFMPIFHAILICNTVL